jgi:hypothetical protein
MAKCGYKYRGKWFDSEATLMAAIELDYSNYINPDGTIKSGLTQSDVDKFMDESAPIEYHADSEEKVRAVPKEFDVISRSLRRYRFKERIELKDGTTLPIKLSSTEKRDIVNGIEGLFFADVIQNLNNRDLTKVEGEFKSRAFKNTVDQLATAKAHSEEYARTIGDVNDTEYQKATQFAQLLGELLEKKSHEHGTKEYRQLKAIANNNYDTITDNITADYNKLKDPEQTLDEYLEERRPESREEYFNNMLTKEYTNPQLYDLVAQAVNKAERALGYSISLEDVKEADEDQDLSPKDSFTNTFKSIMDTPVDSLTKVVKAKFMLYNEYEVNPETNEVNVAVNLLGTPLRYDADKHNAAFLKTSFLFSEDTEYSMDTKLNLLQREINLVNAYPVGHIDSYFYKDLMQDLTKSSKKPFTPQEINQINTVTNKELNNMTGVRVIPRKGREGLLLYDYRSSTAFAKTFSSLNNTFDNLRASELDKKLIKVLTPSQEESKIPTIRSEKDMASFASNFVQNQEYRQNFIENILNESASDLSGLAYSNGVMLDAMTNLSTKASKYKGDIVFAEYDQGELNLTEAGKNSLDVLRELQRTLAKEISRRVELTSILIDVPLTSSSILSLDNAIYHRESIAASTREGNELPFGIPITDALAKFFDNVSDKTRDFNTKTDLATHSLVKWLLDKGTTLNPEAVSMVGNKAISNIVNPIFLNQGINRFNNKEDSYRSDLESSLFSANNRISSIQDNNDAPWVNELYKQPKRAGVKPSDKTVMNKETNRIEQDTPEGHAFYTLGSYLKSISTAHVRDDGSVGDLFKDFDDSFVSDDGMITSYKLKGRVAAFPTPAFSDSDTPFTINNVDFDAVKADGTLKENYRDYYVDSAIVPEINRMVLNRGKVNVRGYEPNLFFLHPKLNSRQEVKNLIDNINFTGKIGSIFDPVLTDLNRGTPGEQNLTKLRQRLREEADKTLELSATKTMNHWADTGLFERRGDHFYIVDRKGNNAMEFDFLLENEKTTAPVVPDNHLANIEKEVGFDSMSLLEELGELEGDYNYEDVMVAFSKHIAADKQDTFRKNAKTLLDREGIKGIFELAGIRNMTEARIERIIKDNDIMSEAAIAEMSDAEKASNVLAIFKREYNSITGIFEADMHNVFSGGNLYNSTTTDRIDTNGLINTDKFRELATRYAYGYSMNMVSLHQTVLGDPAMFYKKAGFNKEQKDDFGKVIAPEKRFGGDMYSYNADVIETMTNLGKRLKAQVAPAVFARGGAEIRYVMTTDTNRKSNYYNGTIKGMRDVGSLDTDDAASYSTLKGALQYMYFEGKLNRRQVADSEKYLENKMSEDEFIAEHGEGPLKHINSLVSKPRAVGMSNRDVEGTNKHVRAPFFIKVAETPLSAAITGDDNDNALVRRRKLLEQLERDTNTLYIDNDGNPVMNDLDNWVSYKLAAPTGVKVGGTTTLVDIDKLKYNEETGEFTNLDMKGNDIGFESSSFSINSRDYGRQLETAQDSNKKVKNTGQGENQLLKGTDENTTVKVDGKDVKLWKEWYKVLRGTRKEGRIALISQFTSDTEMTQDEIVANFLKKAIINQTNSDSDKTNPAIFEWLKIKDGKFLNDITEAPHFPKYMDVIRKEYEKASVTNKRSGNVLALVPDIGIDLRKESGITRIEGIDYSENEGKPKPQTLSNKAQVLVPWDQKYVDPETGKEKILPMDKFINPETKMIDPNRLPEALRERFGFRTPTQGKSMMSPIEVVGFLPRGYKNTIIAPAEFISLMGSDFDIDKMLMYRPLGVLVEDQDTGTYAMREITEDDAKINPNYRKAYWDNRRLKLLNGILEKKDVFEQEVVKPLNLEIHFKKFAGDVQTIFQSETTTGDDTVLQPSYQETKRNNASGAAGAIGQFAKLSRLYSLLHREKPKMEEGGVSIGKGVSLESWAPHKSLFKVNNPDKTRAEKETADLDEISENISALISLSVDDEKLQLLHKLGIDERSYYPIRLLMLAGFKAKTAIAMSNALNVYEENIDRFNKENRWFDSYNALPTSKKLPGLDKLEMYNPLNFEKLAEANSLFSADLTETEVTDRIMNTVLDFNTYGFEDAQTIANMAMIGELKTHLHTYYKDQIKPLNWAVNLDSKGFKREQNVLAEIDMYDESNTEVGEALPEIKLNVESQRLYSGRIFNIFSKNPLLFQTQEYLAENGISYSSFTKVANVIRNQKYARFKPNEESLVGRINSLKGNTNDKKVASYVKSNLFLSRLKEVDGSLVFSKDRRIEDEDIVAHLEELKTLDNLGGIDMQALHEDLVNYGITKASWDYGNSYTQYIKPEYYQKGTDIISTKEDIAKAVVFSSMDNLKPFDANGKTEDAIVRAMGTKDMMVIEKGGISKLVVRGADDTYNEYTKSDYDTFINENSKTDFEQIAEVIDPYEDDTEGDTPINVDRYMDRVLSTPRLQPVKQLLKAVFPHNLRIYSTDADRFDNMEGKSNLELSGDGSLNNLQDAFIHESTHAVLAKVINSHLAGTLREDFPGTNPDGNVIADELSKVLASLEDARGEALVSLEGKSQAAIEAYVYGVPDSTSNPVNILALNSALVRGLGKTHFNNGGHFLLNMTDEDVADALQGESIETIEATIANLNAFKGRKISADKFPVRINEALVNYGAYLSIKRGKLRTAMDTNTNRLRTVIQTDDGARWGPAITPNAFKTFTNIITNTFDTAIGEGELGDLVHDMSSYSLEGETREKAIYERYSDVTYGLTDLHEFTSQAYKVGSSRSIGDFSYSYLNNYDAIADQETSFLDKMLNKVFGLLKGIVDAILGTDNSYFKDTVYAKVLANNALFIQETSPKVYAYKDLSQEILKKC